MYQTENELKEKQVELYDAYLTTLRGSKQLRELLDNEAISGIDSDIKFLGILHKEGYSVGEMEALLRFNTRSGLQQLYDKDSSTMLRSTIRTMVSSGGGNIEVRTGGIQPKSLANDCGAYVQSLDERKPGISTGFVVLDRIISGLKPGKLYIFAARPGIGKTSLIIQILTAIAESNTPCLYYPTEVGATPLWDKIMSCKTNVGLLKFQNGSFSASDLVRIKDAVEYYKMLPISIMEDFAVTPDKVEDGILKYLPERAGTYRGVVAVDFLQSMAWKDPESVAEKAQAVYRFKKMAIDYNMPFILASQLNRGDGTADMRQLKGTGALEELGDVISFIYPTTKPGDVVYPIPTDLNIVKSKYSATGVVKLLFAKGHCRFEPDPNGMEIM